MSWVLLPRALMKVVLLGRAEEGSCLPYRSGRHLELLREMFELGFVGLNKDMEMREQSPWCEVQNQGRLEDGVGALEGLRCK